MSSDRVQRSDDNGVCRDGTSVILGRGQQDLCGPIVASADMPLLQPTTGLHIGFSFVLVSSNYAVHVQLAPNVVNSRNFTVTPFSRA